MTPFALLMQACGLSQREAADAFDWRTDTVKSWQAGRNTAPAGVLAELADLYNVIREAADAALETFDDLPDDVEIEIGYPADDHEARTLGFPCVGAWRAMAAIVTAECGRPVRLVPRGSTVATAGAADAHRR